MGLISAIYTSVNGLYTTEEGFSVVSNNIANLNTAGFKGSNLIFSDIYRSEFDKIGSGEDLQSSSIQFTQGAIMPTGNPLDFAIDGNGFFIVKDTAKDKEYYTRAGVFQLDKDAYVISPDGFRLQGYTADANGIIGTTVGDIQIPKDTNGNFTMDASATTTASMRVNLNAADSAKTWTFTAPSTTPPATDSFNYVAPMNIYDSEGNLHMVDTYFVKTGDNTWDAHVIYNANKTSDNFQEAGTVSLTFDTSGNLTGTSSGSLTFTWGADDWDGDSSTANTTPAATSVVFDLTDSTQYASAHSTAFVETDGYTKGSLESFRTNTNGIISGVYSNGQTRNIAQLVLATFRAPTELDKKGKNLYAVSDLSGPKTETKPGSGGAGIVLGGSIEMSNVDLAKEFAVMITLQRAFQANSTAISTQLEMLRRMENI